jgi:MATE family multidrug resistance protein
MSRLAAAAREGRSLAALAAPIVAGLVVATGITVVDTVMLGPLGPVPLAAAALTSSVLVIFYAGLYGFVGPLGIVAGHAHGSGDAHGIGRAARHGLLLALPGGALSAAAMAAGLLLLPHLGQPDEVVAIIGPYWLAMAAGLLPFAIASSGKTLLDATDRPWTGVLLLLVPVALNAFLDWVLIYGKLGAPALGLAGAGIASLVAQTIGAVIVWGYARHAASVRSWWGARTLSWRDAREQLREGMPMAAQYTLEGGAVAVAGVMVGGFGTVALAANQIALAVGSTLYMLPLGFATALTIRVAQRLGEGRGDRVVTVSATALVVVTGWMVATAALYVALGPAIARLFVSNEAVIATAAAIFVVFGLTQVMDGLQSVALGALRGLRDNAWPTAVSLVAYWLVALPLGALLAWSFGLGAVGVWAGFGAGLGVAATALLWRLRRQLGVLRYAAAVGVQAA